jgi:phage gpG-like protein
MIMAEFTLLSMAEHLLSATAAMVVEQRSALEKAASVVETEAKAEIGHYQTAAGPFAAWETLKDETILRKAEGDTPLLETGDMRDSIGYFVSGDEAHIGSNDDKAVWQELGTVHIPARSFLGGAAVRKSAEVRDIIGEAIVQSLIKPKSEFQNGGEVVIPNP